MTCSLIRARAVHTAHHAAPITARSKTRQGPVGPCTPAPPPVRLPVFSVSSPPGSDMRAHALFGLRGSPIERPWRAGTTPTVFPGETACIGASSNGARSTTDDRTRQAQPKGTAIPPEDGQRPISACVPPCCPGAAGARSPESKRKTADGWLASESRRDVAAQTRAGGRSARERERESDPLRRQQPTMPKKQRLWRAHDTRVRGPLAATREWRGHRRRRGCASASRSSPLTRRDRACTTPPARPPSTAQSARRRQRRPTRRAAPP